MTKWGGHQVAHMLQLCPVWLLCGGPSCTEFREFVRIWPKHADGWGLEVRCGAAMSGKMQSEGSGGEESVPASCDILRVCGGTAEGEKGKFSTVR